MKLLLAHVLRYKKTLFLALALAVVNQVFSLLDPQIFRFIVDNYASRVHQHTFQSFFRGVGLLLLGFIGVALVSRIAKNFQDYYVNVITQKVGATIYADSVSHSFSLPYQIFEDQRSGEHLQRLEKARGDAQILIQNVINIVFFSLVGILLVVAYAFYVNWLIGAMFLLTIPLLGYATLLISRRIKASQQQIVREMSALAGSTTETLRNVELVKSLGLEKQEVKRLNDVNQNILSLELRKVKTVRKLSFLQGTLINALRAGLMLLQLWLIFEGKISLGEFFSLLFYSFIIFNPLGQLGTVATSYQESDASMNRLEEILQIPKEKIPEKAVKIEKIKEIEFRNVVYTYPNTENPAVNNIDFKIGGGHTIAFAGPSGAGKTTIVKLLTGLYQPILGQVLINHTPISSLDLVSFRKRIGLVSQDVQLFAGTVRENLLFAYPEASDQDCTEAMRSAAASSILERGGLGLDTVIGEGGLKLSGGEKQRLAIARALLRKPDMIIFDEATSSLDSITEKEISQTINKIRAANPQLITVLIAHRLSTITDADTIFVLEKGNIVEQGSHQMLLGESGLYSALWREQTASTD